MAEIPKNEEDLEQSLSQEEIDQKKAKITGALEKARLLPGDWTSGKGQTRDEVIAKLEASLTELDNLQPNTAEHEQNDETREASSVKNHSKKEQVEAIRKETKQVKEGEYYSVGGVNIPVCQLPEDNAQWEAVPGKVFVSGGQKFSDVKFVKDTAGLTYTAKPGEPLDFSEKHRNQRLESIDTVLEGREELKVFKEVLSQFGELARQYEELNPDEPNYEKKEKEISGKIALFTDAGKLAEMLDLEKKGLNNADDFAGRAVDIIKTREFLRSLDEDSNEFIPPQDPCFKLTPYFESKLAWFASLINRQLGLGNNAYFFELRNSLLMKNPAARV
jgi:hypothetical protein